MTDTSWIPIAKLARELGINPKTIRRWIKTPNSEFPPPRIFHNRFYFQRNEVSEWKSSQQGTATSARIDKEQCKSVYFIRSGPYVKIGVSDDINGRLKQMQIGSPEKLELLRVVKGGGTAIEKYFHSLFSEFRIRGEWFHWNENMRAVNLAKLEPEGVTAAGELLRAHFAKGCGNPSGNKSRRLSEEPCVRREPES